MIADDIRDIAFSLSHTQAAAACLRAWPNKPWPKVAPIKVEKGR